MQTLARLADGGGEARFDVHMDIFKTDGKIELTGLDLLQDFLQTMNDLLHIFERDDPLLAQHTGMGDGTANILMIEAFVEVEWRR